MLNDDRITYSIIIDQDEQKLDPEVQNIFNNQPNNIKGNLNVKMQRVFWTPLRDGFVIIYQAFNENLLRFSKNLLPENDILDFGILNNEISFKSDYDETILDVKWQVYINFLIKICYFFSYFLKIISDNYVGAIICKNKIYFVREDFKKINTIFRNVLLSKINSIVEANWIGQTLFFTTKTQLYYCTIDGLEVPICSFDNHNLTNSFMGSLVDRILIITKSRTIAPQKQKQKQNQIEVYFIKIFF